MIFFWALFVFALIVIFQKKPGAKPFAKAPSNADPAIVPVVVPLCRRLDTTYWRDADTVLAGLHNPPLSLFWALEYGWVEQKGGLLRLTRLGERNTAANRN